MFAKKFAVAVAVLVISAFLGGCGAFPQKPSSTEEQVPDDVKNIRVMLAQNTQESQWYVDDEINYYATDNLLEIAAEAKKRGEKVNFTRRLSRLSNPPAATVAIANLVVKGFKSNLNQNGLKVVGAACDTCVVVKIDFGHYEGEVMKILFVVPVWQKVTYLFARARAFYQGKLVFETDDTWTREQFKGLLETKAHQEELAAAETAHRMAQELSTLIAKTRQQLIANASK